MPLKNTAINQNVSMSKQCILIRNIYPPRVKQVRNHLTFFRPDSCLVSEVKGCHAGLNRLKRANKSKITQIISKTSDFTIFPPKNSTLEIRHWLEWYWHLKQCKEKELRADKILGFISHAIFARHPRMYNMLQRRKNDIFM